VRCCVVLGAGVGVGVGVVVRFGERNGKSFGFPFHGGRETSEIER